MKKAKIIEDYIVCDFCNKDITNEKPDASLEGPVIGGAASLQRYWYSKWVQIDRCNDSECCAKFALIAEGSKEGQVIMESLGYKLNK